MNLPSFRALPLLLLALPLASQASPPDAANGKTLVEQSCQSCHQDQIYTRPDHKVTNWNKLRNQVQRCELSLGLKWFDTDIEDVTLYLDQQFYKFEPAGK